MSNKAANLAIQARLSLQVQLDYIRNGVRKEESVEGREFEVQDRWGGDSQTKICKWESGEGHWYTHYGCGSHKGKAKWDRSGKTARHIQGRSRG